MKQQLRRSLIFWSGLFVMLCIVWCWHDSMRYFSSATGGPSNGILLGNGFAGIVIGYDVDGGNPSGTERKEIHAGFEKIVFGPFTAPVLLGKRSVPVDRLDELTDRFSGADQPVYSLHEILELSSAHGHLIYLPHWIILSVFLVFWLALLVWRARRRRKRMTNAELPNDE